ncbi:hypothetical protein BH09CHL1_BH09CHL1_19320 [soil metagenome]
MTKWRNPMTATTQINGLSGRYQELFDDVIATVGGVTDEQWSTVTGEEQWSLGVVTHHLAVTQGVFVSFLETITSGTGELPSPTMDQIHAGNAQHAHDFANVTKAETLELLNTNTPKAIELINTLRDDQLETYAATFAGYEMNVGGVVEMIGIGHPTGHFESIKATLGN